MLELSATIAENIELPRHCLSRKRMGYFKIANEIRFCTEYGQRAVALPNIEALNNTFLLAGLIDSRIIVFFL